METLTTKTGAGALVFVGFMGAGKSSAARAVAAKLGVDTLDCDTELERELGTSIEAFFDREGEAAFREREEEAALRLLGSAETRVVSLGGGALASERVQAALAPHTVVHLEVDPKGAWRRASGRGRPLARDRARFERLHAERLEGYREAAAAPTPAAAGRDGAVRAAKALAALREAPEGTRLVWASAESGDYPAFLGRGLVAGGFFFPRGGRPFLGTDDNQARHHSIDSEDGIAVPTGEEHKTIHGAELVLRELAVAGARRGDLVVALGGGVVGDLAGFCAAVYQRGIRHVQVPTTLVAQVDSAYGGKTGVDLPEGKNYVGAYHQPSAVLVDPSALDTLPAEELAAGYAEVLKTALIAGGTLWSRVRDGREPDDEVILGCLRTKLAVVAEDERDEGRRQVLNLGHTVAHAIEAATGYARYRHGEAVGIGLLAALRLSAREALRREVSELLAARGLPLTFSGVAPREVVELVSRDKKRRGASVPFVLVAAPGEVTHGHVVPDADLLAAVEEVHAP